MAKNRLIIRNEQKEDQEISGGSGGGIIPNNTVFTHGTWLYWAGPALSPDLINHNDSTDRLRLTTVGNTKFYSHATAPIDPNPGGFFRRDGGVYHGQILFEIFASTDVTLASEDVYTLRIGTYNTSTSVFSTSILLDYKTKFSDFLAANPTSRAIRIHVEFFTADRSSGYGRTNFHFKYHFYGQQAGTIFLSKFFETTAVINLGNTGITEDYNPVLCLDTELINTKHAAKYIIGAVGEFSQYVPTA